MNIPARFRNALLAVGLAAAVGCSSDDPKSPTAPPTTPVPPVTPVTYAVTVSSSKSVLPVNTTEFANVTVTAARTDNGAAPPNLTKVTLTTTLGAFGNAAGPQTLEAELIGGSVVVAFFPGATVGTATLRAQVSDSVGFASVRVAEEETPTFFISSVSPNVGGPLGGETVTINGGGFDAPLRVLFGGIPATVQSSSSSQIRVRTPALVTDLNDCGIDPSKCNTTVAVAVTINLNEEGEQTDTLANAFSYSNGGGGQILQPIIFSLTPATGPNEGGTQVTINGDGFEPPVQVQFGEGAGGPYVEATILSVSRTRLVVSTPAATGFGQENLNKLVNVKVTNINTGRFAVAESAFRYGVSIRITSMGPTVGPPSGGTQVTIYGQGFDEPVAVGFGTCGAQQILSVSGTEIVVMTVPITVTTCSDVNCGPTSVTNIETGDRAVDGPAFTYRVVKPVITGISPTSGNVGANVTISGQNFATNVQVLFGGESGSTAAVQSHTSTSIVAKVPTPPASFTFNTEPCDSDGNGSADGTRPVPTPISVTVINLDGSNCPVTLNNAFTLNPQNTTCVAGSGG